MQISPNYFKYWETLRTSNCSSFADVTKTDVLKLIKRISINTAVREDQTPPKMVDFSLIISTTVSMQVLSLT